MEGMDASIVSRNKGTAASRRRLWRLATDVMSSMRVAFAMPADLAEIFLKMAKACHT
jgi:hypothetical protein